MTIETKYSIGDKVYFMSNNLPQVDTINTISLLKTSSKQCVEYSLKNYISGRGSCGGNLHPYFNEKDFFKTKEELLQSL